MTEITIFLLFGLLVNPADLLPCLPIGIGAAELLMLVARPLALSFNVVLMVLRQVFDNAIDQGWMARDQNRHASPADCRYWQLETLRQLTSTHEEVNTQETLRAA